MAVKHKSVDYVVERPVNSTLDVLSVLLRCLEQFKNDPDSLPQGQELVKICETIVHSLGRLPVPNEPEAISKFANDVKIIQEFLLSVCMNSKFKDELIFVTLKALYHDISKPEIKPGPAMSVVLELVNKNYIPTAVDLMLKAGHSDASLEQALRTLCDWMFNWTKTPNLSECVLVFIQGLEAQKRFDILRNVTLSVIDKFFSLLMLPAYRSAVMPIVKKMLSCMQDSPDAFHKIVLNVPKIIQILAQDKKDKSSMTCLQDIVNLCSCLMERFPGYDQYEPLHRIFLRYPPSPNYKTYLLCLPWSNYINNLTILKSESGKVGLNNLGNTCYMNSVLQALFMTKLFSNNLLLNEYKWPLLSKLQSLFVLLQYSQRVSLSPNDILHLARPPGFQRGHQHDSSEFLGYLLDVLHEQEKIIANNKQTEIQVSPETDTKQSHSTNLNVITQTTDATVVQRAFGGRAETIYKCDACETESIRADNFRELQLSFPCNFIDGQSVQLLLEYYLKPERLCGDNQYHCDKCNGLSDANRIFRVIQPPARLVLTLKHFRYDATSQQRIKLLHRVQYDPVIKLGLTNYELYAAVVHCGSSVDSGHYYTYAKDGENWYQFNDSSVTKCLNADLHNLHPPETPYILFYRRVDCEEPEPLERKELPAFIEAIIARDNAEIETEKRVQVYVEPVVRTLPKDDDPPSGCGGSSGPIISSDRFIC